MSFGLITGRGGHTEDGKDPRGQINNSNYTIRKALSLTLRVAALCGRMTSARRCIVSSRRSPFSDKKECSSQTNMGEPLEWEIEHEDAA
jgi:hypothetical protein